jgi:hypothetical protein
MTDTITKILTPKAMTVTELAADLSRFAKRKVWRSQVQRWRAGKGITTKNYQMLVKYSQRRTKKEQTS